jgi:hypothetical protein
LPPERIYPLNACSLENCIKTERSVLADGICMSVIADETVSEESESVRSDSDGEDEDEEKAYVDVESF